MTRALEDRVLSGAFDVAQVRSAEAQAIASLPEGLLMRRAAAGLARHCMDVVKARRGRVNGARVLLLVGSGNNGGDALFAGSILASRGAAVAAVPVGKSGLAGCHKAGIAALRREGCRLVEAASGSGTGPSGPARRAVATADLVVDGILGIGGHGALRGLAADLALEAAASEGVVVAVDLPSGVDADTGAVADPAAAIAADVTVTFGCLKPGLVLMPGCELAGDVRLVDIGLARHLPVDPVVTRTSARAAATWLTSPGKGDNKYSRGVVGVIAGSEQYPGAGILCTGSARLGGTGMVRYAGGAADAVVGRWPDVVPYRDGPSKAGRVEAWVFGPGAGTGDRSRSELDDVLDLAPPVLIDADGLTLLAEQPGLRQKVRAREAQGRVTVITPHEGEFSRLGFEVGTDRLGAVKRAARDLGAVVLLKGWSTVVAAPSGRARVNTTSSPALATAGSGDVLSGLAGSLLAAHAGHGLDMDASSDVVATAAFIHGRAGQVSAESAEPVTAGDVLANLGRAIAEVRSWQS